MEHFCLTVALDHASDSRRVSAVAGDVSLCRRELIGVFDPRGAGPWVCRGKYIPSNLPLSVAVIEQHLDRNRFIRRVKGRGLKSDPQA